MANQAKLKRKRFFNLLSTCLVLGLGMLPVALKTRPTLAAQRIAFSIAPFGDFYVSVDSLEVFAKEGKITKDFAFYARRLDESTLAQLRQVLQKRFEINHVTVYRVTNMPMGEELLKRLGQIIKIDHQLNGFYALRSALVAAAADESEGLTVVNVMRHFPTKDIRINTDLIFQLTKELTTLFNYRDTVVTAIAQQAEIEASSSNIDFSQLPDLREPGSIRFTKKTLTFEIPNLRPTQVGLTASYRLDVDIFLPEDISQPAPLVILTHGFGNSRENYQYLARHLASYGLAVAIPEHLGSNLEYRKAFLRGELSNLISPIEYISRTRDITSMLDQLEHLVANDPNWKERLNLEQVGILGNSFGGTTVLSMAGADLNLVRLSQKCRQERFSLNFSLLLQCRASYLPPGDYNTRDSRIKAAFALYPPTSLVFGPESIGEIAIPTLIMASSHDLLTPVIQEQIHPFIWLKTPEKYLALMVPGSHFSTSEDKYTKPLPQELRGPRAAIGKSYLKALSLAFFQTHLAQRPDYQSYLSSSYTQSISQEEMSLKLLNSLTPAQLETAYGGSAPEPIIPETITAALPLPRQETVVEEIKRTGILKVATRSDAAPFGYIDSRQDLWTGYCSELANSFANYLTQKLNLSTVIEVVKLPSTLKNRFQLVQNENVHLECGPNSISSDLEGIVFSNPFFVTGTQFLVKTREQEQVNLSNLEGLKTGLQTNSLTEQFIQQRYPQAETISFQGENARTSGVTALEKGEIDTFADDGILLLGEVFRQDLALENYTLVPKRPLSCNFYGMILPDNDSQWQSTLNSFLGTEQAKQIWREWLTDSFSEMLSHADYCLNIQFSGGTP
ncbi:MAG: alpha/beta hydrolase [Symploca sp. SIO1C4]|uniref:Alpha/beta hydrolase n=1 Tax=Symploca sp. SIO1C4 TaxID=2607765 RepID=A0A6B3N5E6_9CYAN|nr:alpha/beta hydrolase [Symploca sp. SIO1C4]